MSPTGLEAEIVILELPEFLKSKRRMDYNRDVQPRPLGRPHRPRGGSMSVSVAGRSGDRARVTSEKEPTQFVVFAFAVAALAGGLIVLLSLNGRLRITPLELVGWVVLVGLAGVVPLNSRSGPALAMDLPVLLATAFLFGPLASGIIALIGALDIRELRREISFPRALWNRSQTSLSVMAAAAAFAMLGGLGQWPMTPLVAMAAIAADVAVNYTIVGYGNCLRTGVSLKDSVHAMSIGSGATFFVTYVCFGFLGILIAESYVLLGPPGVIASVAPVLLGRQAFFNRVRLDDANETIASNSAALRQVDQRIAEERRDERARIAAALHDEVLQDLYNVTIRAQVLRQDLLTGRLLDLEDDLPAVVRASEAAVEDLREVIQGLRTAAIGHAGLVETLTLFIRHFEDDYGIRVVTSMDTSIASTPEREFVLYQIAREALTNAARHSDARVVWLSLSKSAGQVELVVEDDGCGFDTERSSLGLHFGLRLMRERAASIGGSLEIRSSPGSGTTILLRFGPQTTTD